MPDTIRPADIAQHPAPGGLTLAQVGGLIGNAGLGSGDQTAGERELLQVADELRREGATLPIEYLAAVNRLGEFDTLRSPDALGDPASALAVADLDALDVWTLDRLVTTTTVHGLRQHQDNGATAAVRTVLLTRARNALAAALPDLLAALADDFGHALADVQRAVAAGINATTTPADIIDNDEAITAWRRLVAPDSGVGRLTRLWRLRCRAVRVIGCHVAPAPLALPELDRTALALAGYRAQDYDLPAQTGGIPDGWGRAGRDAWLTVLTAGIDVVSELTAPELIPARIDERTGRSTVPVDAPTKWDLERASVMPAPAPEPTAVLPAGTALLEQMATTNL